MQTRALYFSSDDDHKFKEVAEYLWDSFIGFKAEYDPKGDSMIQFDCDDRFYEQMKSEIRGIG